jgi:hypothetical protein
MISEPLLLEARLLMSGMLLRGTPSLYHVTTACLSLETQVNCAVSPASVVWFMGGIVSRVPPEKGAFIKLKKQTNSVAFSPRANYTD